MRLNEYIKRNSSDSIVAEYLMQDINDLNNEIKTKSDIDLSDYIVGKTVEDGLILIMNNISANQFAKTSNRKINITWNFGLDEETVDLTTALKNLKHVRHQIDDLIVFSCFYDRTSENFEIEYTGVDNIIYRIENNLYKDLERAYDYTMDDFYKFINLNRK